MNSAWLKRTFLDESVLTRAAVRFMAGPGPIVMLLLVRDELDVIRQNIEFHLQYGIEQFVITDNGSVDGTREILSEFQSRLGKALVVIDDAGSAYRQAERVTRMISVAKQTFRPRWIISADADEFWYPVSGRYDTELDGRGNILDCYWHNFLPRPNTPWQQFSEIGEMPGYHGRMKKALCLARGLLGMYTGNHEARTIPHVAARSENIRVYHYPIRTYAQFERKVVQGHRAATQSSSAHASWHWREYYEAWEEGRLPEVYAEMASNNRLGQDFTMADLLRRTA